MASPLELLALASIHNPWRCLLRLNNSYNVTGASILAFDTVVYDPLTTMSTTGASAKITMPVSGIYHIGTTVSWATGGVDVAFNLLINGTTGWCQTEAQAGAGHNGGISADFPYQAVAGDFVQTNITFVSANPTAMGGGNACVLWAVFLSPV